MTAKGRPLHVQLTQGQRHESTVAYDLLKYARGKYLLADAGYDSNGFVDAVRAVGLRPLICPNRSRKRHVLRLDKGIYSTRYLVECFFHKLKRFRAVASHYEKTARNFLALVQFACSMIWLSSN